MSEKTKVWETPQLIILARGTPAEILTTGCKEINPAQGAGPDGVNQDGCHETKGNNPNCGSCQARDGSDLS